LRKIANSDSNFGDVTTLADPEVVDHIIDIVKKVTTNKH
jgi:hypothetical protein